MEPASSVIRDLGGPSVVARIAGVHRTRVSNWMRPKEAGGTGGRIPQNHHRAILKAASEKGLSLSAEELLPNTPSSPTEPSAAPVEGQAA